MDKNFDPLNTYLTSVNRNLIFLNQLLSRIFFIVLMAGIVILLVVYFL